MVVQSTWPCVPCGRLDFSASEVARHDCVKRIGVEADHLDYYRDLTEIREAFSELVERLPADGALIVCADEPCAGALTTPLARLSLPVGGRVVVPVLVERQGYPGKIDLASDLPPGD